MSNFKDWRKPGAYEAFEQAQLAKRLDLNQAKAIVVQSANGPQKFMVVPKPRPITQNCLECRGSGEINGAECQDCKGTGEVVGKRAKLPKAKRQKPGPAPRDHIRTTFVGVDPALRKGGFWVCIICRIDNTATFKACKHLGEFVRILQDCEPAAVIVENSNLQKKKFDEKTGVGGALSVGKNQGVSQAAVDIANEYSEIPSGISPKQKGAKVTNDVIFQGIVRSNGLRLIGYKGAIKAAQDQRDAFMLGLIAEQQYNLHRKS